MTPIYLKAAVGLTLIFTLPLHAQQSSQNLTQLQVQEKTDFEAGKNWASNNDIPELYFLNDHSIVGIIGYRHEQPVFFTTHNQRASTLTRTSNLHSGNKIGLDLDGNNLVIGVWDASLVYENHQEHKARIVRKETGGAANHATHVAGTLIASGLTPEAHGMAPKARLHSYNWNFHLSEIIVEAERGMLISNHSYGRIAGWHKFNLTADSSRWQWFGSPSISTSEDYTFGYYDQEAANFDRIVYANPFYLPVISAGNERDDYGPTEGIYLALDLENRWREYDISLYPISPDGANDGFDTITSMALAKNVLTVGSIFSDSLDQSLNISAFSSAGPTDDGRIKPDIVGVGEDLFSTIASGIADYATYSGTSMATPNVAGSLLLLQQLSRQLFNTYLKASTLKGLVIHTARDLGLEGPDYEYGWGLLDTEKAALLLKDSFRVPSLVQEHELQQDSVFTLELANLEHNDIRLTLAWTDPPFTPLDATDPAILDNPTPALVHNLDIRLVNKRTNESYLPYTLSPKNPHQPATKNVNSVDNVEQILVENAPPGLYKITVKAPNGLSYSDKQPFSLIVSGLEDLLSPVILDSAIVEAVPGDVTFTWITLAQNAPGNFLIERAQVYTTHTHESQTSSFEEIAIIESTGISQEHIEYSFSDPLFLTGIYKYRILFQPDSSPTKVLIEEFEVDVPAPQAFEIASIFPNPTSLDASIVVDLPNTAGIDIQIYNTLGQCIWKYHKNRLGAGRHFISVDVTTMSQGIYFVHIKANGLISNQSFVVVK